MSFSQKTPESALGFETYLTGDQIMSLQHDKMHVGKERLFV